jgi:hypothetical protein
MAQLREAVAKAMVARGIMFKLPSRFPTRRWILNLVCQEEEKSTINDLKVHL